ncbi:hypothetical protein ATCC90586_001703 [Pythium insidiosum]|nr:hypothetical protein ATCC90586_001703 [Pythium insidiosum]
MMEHELEAERRARQATLMRLQELEGEVDTLQRETRRLTFELEAARKVVDVFHDKTDVQDLAEHNLALREQVASLKSLLKELISKLAAKDAQLQMLYQRCASWEQQVIELKFELEAIKHEAKEQDEMAKEAQIDKRRCARIILDLRGELNKQLMDLEQLHNASLLFSPKNSRGIDMNRKSFSHHMNAAA